MRFDPAIALVMMLFALMVGATSVSAFWGYALGRQALSGVTQPDVGRSGRSPDESPPASEESQEHGALKSEEEILAQVTAIRQGKPISEALPDAQADAADGNQSALPDETDADTNADSDSFIIPADVDDDATLVSNPQDNALSNPELFPVMAQHQQVTLTVHSVRRQGNVVRLGVSLQNSGDRPIEFLYSLMDVLDEQGQSLSASTDGLPQYIPATGETFQGAVVVPSVLLGSSNTLSLSLTDYPNQQVQLQIDDIPIAQ